MKVNMQAIFVFTGIAVVILASLAFRGEDCGCPVLHSAGHQFGNGDGTEITYHTIEGYLPVLDVPAERLLPDVRNFDQISGVMARAPQLAVPPALLSEERSAVQESVFSINDLDENTGSQLPGWGWLADDAGIMSQDLSVPVGPDPFESILRRQLFPDLDMLDQLDPWSPVFDTRMPDAGNFIRTPEQPSSGLSEFDL